MKREADILANFLKNKGYKAIALHGDMEQRERQIAIKSFKENREEILVATDVASRGLDISDISHVFNYHMPLNPEIYVHRIGRTGRAGKKGVAITLVTPLEFRDLKRIKEQIKTSLELFEIPDDKNVNGLIKSILEYEVSSNALDLYTQLNSQIDTTQLICKLLSYLSDVIDKKNGISNEEIKRFKENLENDAREPKKRKYKHPRGRNYAGAR